MKSDTIDLAKKTLCRKGKKYRWKTRRASDDSDEHVRVWYTESKKNVYLVDENGSIHDDKKISIDEIREVERKQRGEPVDCVPARHRIKTRKKLEWLNELVDRARAEQRRKESRLKKSATEPKERSKEAHGAVDRNVESARRREHETEKPSAKNASVSFALKSETSDYVMNFRVAPSKKHDGLDNVSVHLGSKFLAYVEVSREVVVKFGCRLAGMKKASTHLPD